MQTVQILASFETAYALHGKNGVISFCGIPVGCQNSSDVAVKFILVSVEESLITLQTLRVSPVLKIVCG